MAICIANINAPVKTTPSHLHFTEMRTEKGKSLIALKWEGISQRASFHRISYEVLSEDRVIEKVTRSSVIIGDLEPGHSYQFTVRALNTYYSSMGNLRRVRSDESSRLQVTTPSKDGEVVEKKESPNDLGAMSSSTLSRVRSLDSEDENEEDEDESMGSRRHLEVEEEASRDEMSIDDTNMEDGGEEEEEVEVRWVD